MKFLNIKYFIKLILVFICSGNLYAQVYSFGEIKENFFGERPRNGNIQIRENSFGSIDDLIFGVYPPLNPGTKKFYSEMLRKALLEIESEKVESGVTVWQIYNMGFIVKSSSFTIGFDLFDYFDIPEFLNLADILDISFISHSHNDHYSEKLTNVMKALGKPVVGPSEIPFVNVKLQPGESTEISGITIIAHNGLHSVPLRQFEIITPEGIKILHTGDNQTSTTVPVIPNLDILLLNSWVNESGTTTWIEGSRLAIAKAKPKVTLPGHILELGHLGSPYPPVPYRDVIEVDNGNLDSEYYVMAWGERYHYPDASDDTVPPENVYNLNAVVYRDSILVSWETSTAPDGDTANFYRIILDDSVENFTLKNEVVYPIDSLRTYNFKVYSYDDCGNQSESYTELTFTPPSDINYPPRITGFYPENNDTVSTFAGVRKKFTISAMDFNHDELTYIWRLNEEEIYRAKENTLSFNISSLNSGIYNLACVVTDGQDSARSSWIINHITDFAIVDNDDSLMYSDYGTWLENTVQKAYGRSCRYSLIENIGDWALFKYFPVQAGEYDVFEIILQTNYAADNVLYNLTVNNHQIDSVYINQNIGSGAWVKIGRYYFPSQSEVNLKIINNGTSNNGTAIVTDAVKFVLVNPVIGINGETKSVINNFNLLQNHPNPFNSYTTISYVIPRINRIASPYVTLSIYDVLGNKITVLVNGKQQPGKYTLTFDASELNSGIYFYRLQVGNYAETKKMVLMK